VGQPSDPQWFRHSPHRNTPDTPSSGPTYHHRFVVTALDIHVISGGVGGPGDDPDSVVAGLRVSEFNTRSVQLPVSTLGLLGGLRRRLPGVDKRTVLAKWVCHHRPRAGRQESPHRRRPPDLGHRLAHAHHQHPLSSRSSSSV
jgi:hypothetical protein